MDAVCGPQIDRRMPENRISKPTLTVRPDWLENREGQRARAKTPNTLGLAELCSRLFVGMETQTDRMRERKGDRKRTAAVCEWIRDNHGYGRESRD
jgi:hypothetical protein